MRAAIEAGRWRAAPRRTYRRTIVTSTQGLLTSVPSLGAVRKLRWPPTMFDAPRSCLCARHHRWTMVSLPRAGITKSTLPVLLLQRHLATHYDLIFQDWESSTSRQGVKIDQLIRRANSAPEHQPSEISIASTHRPASEPAAGGDTGVTARDISPDAIAWLGDETAQGSLPDILSAVADMRRWVRSSGPHRTVPSSCFLVRQLAAAFQYHRRRPARGVSWIRHVRCGREESCSVRCGGTSSISYGNEHASGRHPVAWLRRVLAPPGLGAARRCCITMPAPDGHRGEAGGRVARYRADDDDVLRCRERAAWAEPGARQWPVRAR